MTIETIEEAKELFARTIFYNWLDPVDEGLADPDHADAEYPLKVIQPPPPAYRKPDDGKDGYALLRFEAGETSIDVAEVHITPGEESATLADARFIAELPVVVPLLLRRIAELEAELEKERRRP